MSGDTVSIRGPLGARQSRILGVGAYRPVRVVSNDEICERIDSSDEWIRTRTGITERRFAGHEETLVAMSVDAATAALENSGVGIEQIGCVVVATVTHLYQTPSAAVEIADRLGSTAPAFDLSAACAGFCYGLSLASDMVRGGTAEHVLVIGVERLSDIVDPFDRSAAFIFADGAGAVVVGPSEEPGLGPVVWGSDGSQLDLIRQEESWDVAFAKEGGATWPHMRMEGNPVFRWASFEMAKVAKQALDAAGVGPEDLDVFVPHQANMRITDAMARAIGLPPTVAIARDVAEQGNTSAASVPLALERMLATGEAKSGDLALLIGFGAGLAFAAQVARVP